MMKQLLWVAASAFIFNSTQAQEHQQETIEGNGKIVTREIPVKSFDALKASGVYQLELTQGNTESVKIEADENLQDLFIVHNEGDKLVIEMKKMEHKNLNFKTKLKVFVSFKNLKNMELSTVGDVHNDKAISFDDLELSNRSVGHVDLNMNVNKLELKNTSVGNVKLTGTAQRAVVRNSGVGSLHAENFIVQSMNIENTGVGSASVNAIKDCKVMDSFLGKVKNKGTAPVKKMNKVVI